MGIKFSDPIPLPPQEPPRWPLCPKCGSKDGIWLTSYNLIDLESHQPKFSFGARCRECGWSSEDGNPTSPAEEKAK